MKWPQAGAGTSGGMVVWTKDRFENVGRFFP
nr:MAG TPA: Nitrous oxide reductase propeller repeat [Caudoviricetes sp.]